MHLYNHLVRLYYPHLTREEREAPQRAKELPKAVEQEVGGLEVDARLGDYKGGLGRTTQLGKHENRESARSSCYAGLRAERPLRGWARRTGWRGLETPTGGTSEQRGKLPGG